MVKGEVIRVIGEMAKGKEIKNTDDSSNYNSHSAKEWILLLISCGQQATTEIFVWYFRKSNNKLENF